jgi:hypothetical protein
VEMVGLVSVNGYVAVTRYQAGSIVYKNKHDLQHKPGCRLDFTSAIGSRPSFGPLVPCGEPCSILSSIESTHHCVLYAHGFHLNTQRLYQPTIHDARIHNPPGPQVQLYSRLKCTMFVVDETRPVCCVNVERSKRLLCNQDAL